MVHTIFKKAGWKFGFGVFLVVPLAAQGAPPNYDKKLEKLVNGYDGVQAGIVVNQSGNEEQINLLKQKHQDFVRLVEDAKKDGITPEEWRLIKRAYNRDRGAQDQVRFKDENLLKRVEGQRRRIAKAFTEGQITEAQKTALEKKLVVIETRIKTKGGSVKFLRALNKQLSQNNNKLTDYRTDDQGEKWRVADRKKDGIDERQNKLMRQFGHCLGRGNVADTEEDYLRNQILAINKKERQYADDGNLTKEEKDDLNQLLAKAEGDTRSRCEKGVVAATLPVAGANGNSIGNTDGTSGGALQTPTQEITPSGGNSTSGL